jgi:lactate racemase
LYRLAYGKQGLEIELPDSWDITVVEPVFIKGLDDPRAALRRALLSPIDSPPLHDLVQASDRVGIIFSDITRPTPNRLLIPAIIDELAYVPDANITLFGALGTHRPNTESELRQMLGDAIFERFRIVQNDAFDPSTQVCLGMSPRGHEIWINRELMDCNAKILTGFIEPHFFAGFSGGGKAIMPGMAGQKTVLGNHDWGMLSHPKATWGETQGNPIWEEIHSVAAQVNPTFLLNVSLNKGKEITGVFAGNLTSAHAAGCAFVKSTSMVPVPHLYDIVITTNSGYPLDLNLYQAVKGMSAASQIVRQGGTIIIAAECWDGIPDHGLYGELLRQAKSPESLLATISAPGFLEQDQWQVQIQGQIQLKAEVYVYSDGLTNNQIRGALFKPCRSIPETMIELMARFGPEAHICILPEGPQTVPYHSP